MFLNFILGLYMLLTNPKLGIASFAMSLIMLRETAGTTQQTYSPQPLLCKAEADKIYPEIFIYSLETGEEVGVV